MSKKLVLIGAGGFGREVAEMVRWINEISKTGPIFDFLGFLDDGERFSSGMKINGVPWIGPVSWILDHKDEVYCTCAIGDSATRARIQKALSAQGVRFATIIAGTTSKFSTIGPGSIISWNVMISTNCELGEGVVLNDGVKIGHDVVIGDFTSIMSDTGISGGCLIGNEVNIGGHAFLIPKRKVGDRARIAAGSIVFSNVKAGTTVLGNPAKRMKEIE